MRNVLVTGASRGIGLAIASHLASAGYGVVATARRGSDELDAAIRAADGATGCIRPRAFDLADIEAIPAFVRGLRQEFGNIYGLVNNAGLGTAGLLANMPDAEIKRLVRLNTLSPLILTKYVTRLMLADGEGRIINVSSIVGSTGFNGLSVYGATKGALIGFTRSLAREVGSVGVTVNAVAPGFIDTNMTESLVGEDRARVIRRSALRRLADAEDVAAGVAFLLGDGGRNITGTVLTIDAGSTA